MTTKTIKVEAGPIDKRRPSGEHETEFELFFWVDDFYKCDAHALCVTVGPETFMVDMLTGLEDPGLHVADECDLPVQFIRPAISVLAHRAINNADGNHGFATLEIEVPA